MTGRSKKRRTESYSQTGTKVRSECTTVSKMYQRIKVHRLFRTFQQADFEQSEAKQKVGANNRAVFE